LKVTLLGSGTSQGVPVIACKCEACLSDDIRDKRLRCSVHVQINDTNIIIDVGPDFRQQILKFGPQELDAVFLTHEHNDHVAGLDDLRPFVFRQKKDMPIYAQERVLNNIKIRYAYAFEDNKYPGLPRFELFKIDEHPFYVNDVEIIPIPIMHGQLPILGFRIGDFTYITDALTISESSLEKIKGTKVLVINALQINEHYSHLNLSGALELIQNLKPKTAYLTHISHTMGPTAIWEEKLPSNVFPAFDGLNIEL
jgi:phosphoribosyl 1,2-cyclic phosphate phosphodiesterase